MIVAEQKPIDEILGMLKPYQKIALVGCNTCVAVCMAGGEKEVGILASAIRLARKTEGSPIEITEIAIERQCDDEFIEPILDQLKEVEAVLSIACGVGVQHMGEKLELMTYPGLNTEFMGANLGQGVWSERCAGCGDCILYITGGICPIARCAKTILNGPCGGSAEGKCEVDPELDCAWQLIYDRLKTLNRLQILEELQPIKDWQTARDGGPRKVVREDVKL